MPRSREKIRRLRTIPELDRLLGDSQDQLGAVRGSTILVQGPAGVGKTTLVMQAVEEICRWTKRRAVYASPEQPGKLLLYMADRVGLSRDRVTFHGGCPNVQDAIALATADRAICLVVDSVSLVYDDDIRRGPAGSPKQITAAADRLGKFVRKHDAIGLLVQHTQRTKDGAYLEHAVDTAVRVDPFEPTCGVLSWLRLFTTTKHRYGPEGRTELLETAADGSGMSPPSPEARSALVALGFALTESKNSVQKRRHVG